jgi:hypothetical protein
LSPLACWLGTLYFPPLPGLPGLQIYPSPFSLLDDTAATTALQHGQEKVCRRRPGGYRGESQEGDDEGEEGRYVSPFCVFRSIERGWLSSVVCFWGSNGGALMLTNPAARCSMNPFYLSAQLACDTTYPPFTYSTSPTIALNYSAHLYPSPPPLSYFPPTSTFNRERARKQTAHASSANIHFAMPAPSASQQKAQANEVANVLQIDSKTAAKLLAKSGWSTSVAINSYVHTLFS